MNKTEPGSRQSSTAARTLGLVADMAAVRHEGGRYVHASFGRIVDRLAGRYREILLCLPVRNGAPPQTHDYPLGATNVRLVPQPGWRRSVEAIRHPLAIIRAYSYTCRHADALLVRGLCPFVLALYAAARHHRRHVCHWLIGNSLACIRSNRRAKGIRDYLAMAYAWANRLETRFGRRLAGGTFLCNGSELAALYASPRTSSMVSSTITEEEFFERPDTCTGPVVRILFVGFVRPEKGVEYLLEALSRLHTDRPWELVIVGPRGEYPDYDARLDRLAARQHILEHIRWEGYVPYGPALFEHFRQADILALPTLSEGTPRVLVEARANSLPLVATRVGGIPDSVRDGKDGLLVPAKDSTALAQAIDRIIADGALRQRLIKTGFQSVRALTLDRAVCALVRQLHPADAASPRSEAKPPVPTRRAGTE